MNVRDWRWSCDSLVALAGATDSGATIFAKNSDRPAWECQPLCDVPRVEHGGDAWVQCTYIRVRQARVTYRVIGSRPYWGWGFEHGVNEHGVAIGNHTVFTKEPVAPSGLTGMDLVRLGLERAQTASEAVQVMAELLATYGQGGSGFADKDWPYHNSFLVADAREAYVWETSGAHWALRRVRDVASVSNHLTIGSDWDELGPDTLSYAVSQGWWPEETSERFDFARAYRDTTMAPEVISSGRYARTCRLLESARTGVRASDVRNWMRDHYGRKDPQSGLSPADPEYFSVCMHADPVGTTTASVVAELAPDPRQTVVWVCMGAPCSGIYLPLFLDVPIPEALTRGSAEYSDDSAWWRSHRLLELVQQSWESRLPIVRAAFDPLEEALASQISELKAASREEREALVQAAAEEALEVLADLVRRLS